MKGSLAQNRFLVKIFYKICEPPGNLLQCMYRDVSKGKAEAGEKWFHTGTPEH